MVQNGKTPYEKIYKMRAFKGNYAVSIPPEVIRREAKNHGLAEKEFIGKFCLVAQYDNFDGIHYQFVLATDNSDHNKDTAGEK